jgi:hypothetical protein
VPPPRSRPLCNDPARSEYERIVCLEITGASTFQGVKLRDLGKYGTGAGMGRGIAER